MNPRDPQLWLNKAVTVLPSGHYGFEGDCGLDPVIVELDRSAAESAEAALKMHSLVQETARRMWKEGRAFETYPDGSDGKLHWIMAITPQDLSETEQV